MKKVLFCRVGWCKYYDDIKDKGKRPIGGGSYNKDEVGHEVYSFKPEKGILFGYVQPSMQSFSRRELNLERISVNLNDKNLIEDVLVIFFATSIRQGAQVVVGWYKDASVYRKYQKPKNQNNRNGFTYNLVTSEENGVLLNGYDRKWKISDPQSKQGRPGTSNVFYVLNEKGEPRKGAWINEILEKIENFSGDNLLHGGEYSEEKYDEPAKTNLKDTYRFEGEFSEKDAHNIAGKNESTVLSKNRSLLYAVGDDARKLTNSDLFPEAVSCLLKNPKLKEVHLLSFVTNKTFFEQAGLTSFIKSNPGKLKVLLAPPAGTDHLFAVELYKFMAEGLLQLKQVGKVEYSCGLMHNKLYNFVLADENYLTITGSANATGAGINRNMEYSVAFTGIMDSEKLAPVNYFNDLWEKSEEFNPLDFCAIPEGFVTPQTTSKTLFKYQKAVHKNLNETFLPVLQGYSYPKTGAFLVMPTGSGKTFTMVKWLFDQFLKEKHTTARVLWLSHRTELLEQATREIESVKWNSEIKVEVNPVFHNHYFGEEYFNKGFIICSCHKASGKYFDILKALKFDLIIVDESHRASGETEMYGTILRKLEYKALIGLSATPYRGGGVEQETLATHFHLDKSQKNIQPSVVASVTLEDVKKENPKIFSEPEFVYVDTQAETILGEDFSDYLDKLKSRQERNSFILESYINLKKEKNFRSALFFCIDCEHANQIAEMLNECGQKAQVFHMGKITREGCQPDVTGDSISDFDRFRIIQDFRTGKIECLVTVGLLTEGFDVPNIDAIFLTRPTFSTVLMTQMIGRGLRGPAVGGSEKCLIVDFHDKVKYHQINHELQIKRATRELVFEEVQEEDVVDVYGD
ncbi:DEAD/DEAH box helicase family protein [Cytophagaceae bacterium ABcell3]|nr:DEAD/DEAH box helicase family protein [Cytophagaceae bacterium ABcell3]